MQITGRDARFIQLAMEESEKSSMGMRHGCIAVMHGKIIARAFNETFKHSSNLWWSGHAEVQAIKAIKKNIVQPRRITLYVVRTTNSGSLHDSAPCLQCINAIQKCPHIKRIIYSDSQGSITRCSPHSYTTNHISWGLRFHQI